MLLNAGQTAQALPWFQCLTEAFVVDRFYSGPRNLQAGEVCEALGLEHEAARHYRSLIRLWGACDPDVRPLLDEARARLAKLEPGRS